jgi:type I restriction-modification system DNA methylase subunit
MSLSSFIWSVADLLRGDYKQSEYGKVITVNRHFDVFSRRARWKRLTHG